MAIYILVFAVPLVTVFVTSFCDYTPFTTPAFAGLANFKTLFVGNSDFADAIRNTLLWVLLQCTVNVFIGVGVALLLYRKPRGWKFFRASYMIPNIIPTAAMGFMFFLLYNPDIGMVKALWSLFGSPDSVPNLFGNSSYSFAAVTSTWLLYSAFNTILVMSEIMAIPEQIFESAKVDGANAFQIDLFITIPMLRNIIVTCIILAAVGMVSQFDILYLTTRGGPGSASLNLPVYLFKTANLEMNYGLANATGVVQILLGLLLVVIIGRVLKFGQQYD